MAQVYDMAGDTLVVNSIVTGVATPGMAQIGNPNIVGVELGAAIYGYQTANSTSFVGTTATTLQPVFNISTNGAMTVAGNQTYLFEAMYTIAANTGGTATATVAHSWAVGFGGNATVASIGYQLYATANTASGSAVANSVSVYVSTVGASPLTPSVSIIGEQTNIYLNGVVSFNGGGTFIPQIKASATMTGSSIVISKGSYIGMWPIGNATTQTVGTWS